MSAGVYIMSVDIYKVSGEDYVTSVDLIGCKTSIFYGTRTNTGGEFYGGGGPSGRGGGRYLVEILVGRD